jgi:hypothetical protein
MLPVTEYGKVDTRQAKERLLLSETGGLCQAQGEIVLQKGLLEWHRICLC